MSLKKCLIKCRAAFGLLLKLGLILILLINPVQAQVVEDVVIRENDKGYKIEVKLFIPLRYQSHTPEDSGTVLEIQMRPGNLTDPDVLRQLNERVDLSWDRNTGIPLSEITYDGGLAQAPSLLLRFTKEVKFKVRSSPNLRSIIILIETAKPQPVTEKISEKVSETASLSRQSENLITALKLTDPKMADLLDQANQEMLNKNYSKSVQIFTKIKTLGNAETQRHVQELLGVVRELNGQQAHAKAEYQKYLENYPDSEEAARVNQRLAALITAAARPKDKLPAGRRRQTKDGTGWDTQIYGGFSQIYFRDELTPEKEDSFVLRSDLNNDLDFVARARKGDYDLKAQFIGSYLVELLSEGTRGNEFIPSIATIGGRHSGTGLEAVIGRQSRTTGGIQGRFDGLYAGIEINPEIRLNAVIGYPVEIRNKTELNTDQKFYGISADISSIWEGWDFNAYYISQENAGIKDREALGGEIRYFDPGKSAFTLIDYDLHFDELNLFLFIGNWTVVPGTIINLVLDYRKSPLLSTTTAIVGQGVEQLEDLFDRYSESELHQLALDRTAESKSVTAGLTQQINDNLQFIGELTVTEFGATVASGGVEATPGTGKEYLYSTQLVANNVVFENDIMIMGVRYIDTARADTYSFSGNWRINASPKLRINPRIRVDYREDKDNLNTRWLVRPFIRMDYRIKKWVTLELELGYEWLREDTLLDSRDSTGYFLSAGYRARF